MAVTIDEIVKTLKDRVALLTGNTADQIASDQPLHRLGLDSMGFVDLLVFIEKQFNLSLMTSGLAQSDFASLDVLAERIALAQAGKK